MIKQGCTKRHRDKRGFRMRKKAIILGTCIILFVGALSTQMGHFRAGTDAEVSDGIDGAYDYNNMEDPEGDNVKDSNEDSREKIEAKQYIEVDTKPDSYTVLVNRDYLISKDYVPDDLVVPEVPFSYYGVYEKSYVRKRAAKALEHLFAGARSDGYTLKVVSAYRSYERQMQIYRNNVKTRGKDKTNKVSAMPGSSEHQTGLAIDVSADSVGCTIEESFARSAEGKWLKKNCYKYGFIIRYPKNKTKITGYSYEPWHIRYVGKNLAQYLKKNKLTLEEYYKLTTVDNKVEEDAVRDTDTDITNEPQMTSAPKPKATIVPTPAPTYAPAVESPTVTKKPMKKPKVTATPVQRPVATKKPKPTEEPDDVDIPDITQEPQPTKKPVATKKPVETKKPTPTKKPVATAEPEPTEVPVVDEDPSDIGDGTASE